MSLMCFTSRLDTAEEEIADLEVTASKTSKQRERRLRKQIDYQSTV